MNETRCSECCISVLWNRVLPNLHHTLLFLGDGLLPLEFTDLFFVFFTTRISLTLRKRKELVSQIISLCEVVLTVSLCPLMVTKV